MGTTLITVTNVAGPIVGQIRDCFVPWIRAGRRISAGAEQYSEVEDTVTIEAMFEFCRLLDTNADQLPIVSFERFLDPWTICPALSILSYLGNTATLVASKTLDLMFIEINQRSLPLVLKLRKNVKDRELKWLALNMEFPVRTWESLFGQHGIPSALLVTFRLLGPSRLDEEVLAHIKMRPQWLDMRGTCLPHEHGEKGTS